MWLQVLTRSAQGSLMIITAGSGRRTGPRIVLPGESAAYCTDNQDGREE